MQIQFPVCVNLIAFALVFESDKSTNINLLS